MTPALERVALIPVDPGTKQPFGKFISGRQYRDFEAGRDYRGSHGGETGHVTSESVWLLAVDVDGTKAFDDGTIPPQFPDTALGRLLGGEQATAIATYARADGQPKYHLYIVPPEGAQWPVQWATHEWAYDLKSNGFVRAEPAYAFTGTPPLCLSPDTWADFTRALRADQFEYGKWASAHNKARQGSVRSGKTIAEWMEESGYATYSQIPDDSMGGDNDLCALVASMYSNGADEDDIRDTWERVSYAKESPWTDSDYERHLRNCEGKYSQSREEALQRLASNDALEEMRATLPPPSLADQFAGSTEDDRDDDGVLMPASEARTQGVLRNGTDQYLAEQCVRISSPEYQRARDSGAWFRRNGDAWMRVPEDPCDEIVARIAATLTPPEKKSEERIAEGTAGKDDPLSDDEKLFARMNMSKQASGVITKMRAVSKTRARISEELLDGDPCILWAGSVPYDLRTCTRSTTTEDVHLLTAGYAPADGPTPLWDGLNEAQFPDEELREYTLSVLASILPGGAGKLLPNFKADGNLGKTTRLMMMADVLGTYAEQLPVQLLGNYSGHDEMYLRLKGKRMAYMDETPPSGKVANEKLKHLSGGGRLTGRAINGRTPITFTMTHTLFLAGNDDLPLGDANVQRRIRYLPITGSKDEIAYYSKRIWNPSGGSFSPEWYQEAPAVLWKLMLRASAVLRDRSLCDMPPAALSCFADAIIDQDNIGQFVRDCCTQDGETSGSSLHEAYVAWCLRHGIRQHETITAFGNRLSDMGYPARKTAGPRLRPLKLKPFTMAG